MYGNYVAAAAVLLGVTVVAPRVRWTAPPRAELLGWIDDATVATSDGVTTFRVRGGDRGDVWVRADGFQPRQNCLFYGEGDYIGASAHAFVVTGVAACGGCTKGFDDLSRTATPATPAPASRRRR